MKDILKYRKIDTSQQSIGKNLQYFKEENTMNNGFFVFVKTYWEEICDFFDAFYAFVKALIDKATNADAEEE